MKTLMMSTKVLLSHNRMFYALYKMRRQYHKDGYCYIASPLWICSQMTSYYPMESSPILECWEYSCDKEGQPKVYGTVWYHPLGIANILSLSNVQKKYRVMYNSTLDQGFIMRKADGTTAQGPSLLVHE